MGAIPAIWNTLTDKERQSWNAYSSNTQLRKSEGSIHMVSGYHHFVRSNTARMPIGDEFEVIRTAPSTPGLPPELVVTNTGIGRVPAGPTIGRISFLIVADIPAAPFMPGRGNWVLAYLSKPFNVGKSSYHQGFSFLDFTVFPEFGETPFAHVFTTTLFRPTTDPFKIQMRLVVSLQDGRTSNPLTVHGSFP